jgi:hypothetical protein
VTDTRVIRAFERLAIVVASLALSIGLIIALSGYFAGRDQAGVTATGTGPGVAYPDLGNTLLRPGELRPPYNSVPPTSGAHELQPVLRDGLALNDDQLLTALAQGNVVFLYGGRTAPAGLDSVARSVAGPFTPALAASGQAVILGRRTDTAGVTGVAWTRLIHVSSPGDPLLKQFAEYWLGRGARTR